MESDAKIDYLVAGHICWDVLPDGRKMGGTAAYSAGVAHELGYNSAVFTSSADSTAFETLLPSIALHTVAAPQTTTFENVYLPERRLQVLHAVGGRLTSAEMPAAWQNVPIVHLGPIANEVDIDLIDRFPNSLIGLTPQGWMRRWSADGKVYAERWEAARTVLPKAAATVISEEDLLDDAMLGEYRQWANVLVLTRGMQGCTVFVGDEVRDIPAINVSAVELTGAGDTFATAFFVRLYETKGDAWEAARFANQMAALSVSVDGITAIREIIRANRSNTRVG